MVTPRFSTPVFIGSCLLALVACGKIVVTGRVRGAPATGSGVQNIVKLAVTRGSLEAVNEERVQTFEPGTVANVWNDLKADLSSAITNNPSQLGETYHLVSVFRDADTGAGGTSDDPSFVPNHLGRFFHLAIGQADSPRQAADMGGRSVGAAWLAVVDSDDRTIPWHIEPASQNCFPMNGGTCFDMENLTHRLFIEIVNGIATKFSPADTIVERLHFVPHVIHQGLEHAGTRARGVGFIFTATVEAPTVTVDIAVPISILFFDNATNYRVQVDPLSFAPTDNPGSENLGRIVVRGSFPANLVEGPIRDSVTAGIQAAPLPEIIPGIPFETALISAINGAAGLPPLSGQPARISPRYDVVLLPDDTGTLDSTIVWEKFRGFDEHAVRTVRLAFLE